MFKVTYWEEPEVNVFDTEEEAHDYMKEEIERRVSLKAKYSSDDLNSLREVERSLVDVEDWRE